MPGPTPDPDSAQYRTQVQEHIQGVVSGTQPRDPHLSKASTGRLILEGVVENVKIYRLYREEKLMEAKEKEKGKKEMSRGDRGRNMERHRHRHRGRSEERHRRRRSREGSRDRHRERSRGGEGSRERLLGHDGPDQVRYEPFDAMMTGGAGPAGTLPSHDQNAERRPRSRTRSQPKRHSPRRSQARAPRSSTRRKTGPDGATQFGDLPKKVAGVGLAAHFLNTYRHIKAEHDSGHRSRSAVEKVVDGWRGKTPGAVREAERLLKKEPKWGDGGRSGDGRGNDRRRGDRGERSGRDRTRDEGRGRGHDRPRNVDRGDQDDRDKDFLRRPATPYPPRGMPPNRQSLENETPAHPPRAPSPRPHTRHSELYNRTPSPPGAQVRDVTPPTRLRSASPPWPPAASNAVPPYPDTPRGRSRSRSPAMAMPPPPPPSPPSPPPMPASRPRPPPPPTRPRSTPNRGALLDEISGGAFNLKPVRKVDEKSDAAYSTTSHSRAVEERERRQTWSDVDDRDEDNESERRKVLKETLEAQFTGGSSGKNGKVFFAAEHEHVGLIKDNRTVMKSDDEKRDERIVDSQHAIEDLDDDGWFSNLAEHVGTPSWNWGGLPTGKGSERRE
ncbi:hypothetical protein CC86DRAFT_403011 [Ophiobolus disseminans]|uniref:WH2 domain-containing protein n=1 Tax=Ophiobolus disseminans TaxID=1469910 RepID=A0A6A7AAP8_9PLEO|nr:hypothetical protein CC86DRAFT_403011 [Ophiobolus disseminans]